MNEQELSLGLDVELTERVKSAYIHEGRLYGAVPQQDLTADERLQLSRAGWQTRNYQDRPVMEPPQATVDWDDLRLRHRDRTLHAISHRLPGGTPWAGNRQAILEEILGSVWEQQEDELRVLLHAWAFASVWGTPEENRKDRIESAETFFFYTTRMRDTAERALATATEAPPANADFWQLVFALNNDGI